jgi:transcriptional regulator with XRE-family HTH domain
MDTLEKVKELCKQKGITVQQLEIEIGEKPSAIAKISSNSKAEKLDKIAQYFGVTIEYLIRSEEAQSVIDRVTTEFNAPDTPGSRDQYYFDIYRKDREFWEIIRKLYFLPPDDKEFVYRAIDLAHNNIGMKEKKEGINSASFKVG